MAPQDNQIDQEFSKLFEQEHENDKYEGIKIGGESYNDEEEIEDQVESVPEPPPKGNSSQREY